MFGDPEFLVDHDGRELRCSVRNFQRLKFLKGVPVHLCCAPRAPAVKNLGEGHVPPPAQWRRRQWMQQTTRYSNVFLPQ